MSEKKYDLLVFIGRFQPFHNGHKHVVDAALEQAYNVLILVGSANRPVTNKNPWTFEDRKMMIRNVYPKQEGLNLAVCPLDDYLHDNDFHWMMNVQKAVENERVWWTEPVYGSKPRIGLIGFSKDQSSYYLKKFPQWDSINVEGFKHEGKILDATSIRKLIIEGDTNGLPTDTVPELKECLPEGVRWWMDACADEWLPRLVGLRAASDFVSDYRTKHKYVGGQSYMPLHTTTDAVVIQSGHVLLGRRGFNPGKGLLALPGGFVHEFEPCLDACLRELREETTIDLPDETLKLAFRFKQVFSDVNRSDERGRIITHAYLFLLNDRATLPKVKADDDMAEGSVGWYPLGLLDPKEIYSDHYFIIRKMIDMIPID